MKLQDLIDAARANTGLDDFGAESWREGLEKLIHSLDHEAELNAGGQAGAAAQITALLSNRLQIEDWYARHPEIEEQEIVSPLFGLGLPRTGSTALGQLFGQDPGYRSLRTWEAVKPCPPPETATQHSDPRIAETQARLDLQIKIAPGIQDMVPLSATGPTECLQLLALDFCSGLFEASVRVPSYSAWLDACDMTPAYRYHKRVLKLLQWRCPPSRWWLRTPAHMAGITALDAVYPDARFVMTHRDVASVVPSVARMQTTLTAFGSDLSDPAYFGTHCSERWALALKRMIAFRDDGREDRFHDMEFRTMQSDPIGSMRRLYAALGQTLSPVAEQQMTDWWAQNGRGQAAGSRYSPEDYGLSLAGLRTLFVFYSDRFDIDTLAQAD